jgi:NAD(P)-dependent dehydrogenase (short-subunit alcohol dehydrogenase family)
MMITADNSDVAIVTGAGRGFGRAVAMAFAVAGWQVVGVARTERDLDGVRDEVGDRFIACAADAAGEGVAEELITRYDPRAVVLNAGATPHMAPIGEQTWDTFSTNWVIDTRHAFNWTKAALTVPLRRGSTVVSMSSGAALRGSPLSGGFAGAKAAIGFLSDYAAEESRRADLGLTFVTVFPMLSPTGVGAAGVAAYAAQQGVTEDAFIAGLGPVLTPQLVGKAVLDLFNGPSPVSAYVLTGAGAAPVRRDR